MKTIKTYYWIALSALLFMLFTAPQLYAHGLFNYAQLQRLHGIFDKTLYTRAIALAPHNAHMRWQVAEIYVLHGEPDMAATLLQPLLHSTQQAPLVVRRTIAILVATDHDQDALQLYMSLASPPDLPPTIAARLLTASLHNTSPEWYGIRHRLFADVFRHDHDSPELAAFVQRTRQPGFWQTDLGKQVQQSLAWSEHISATHRQRETVATTKQLHTRVISMTRLAPDAVTLGKELLHNGSFEQLDAIEGRLLHWEPWQAPNGIFVSGSDATNAYQGAYALRIDGIQTNRQHDQSNPFAGFIQRDIVVQPHTLYAVSFAYRTEHVSSQKGMWFTLTWQPEVLFSGPFTLSPTDGQWKYVTIVAWNRSSQAIFINPAFRMYRTGSVWFDACSLSEIVVAPDVVFPQQEPLIQFR